MAINYQATTTEERATLRAVVEGVQVKHLAAGFYRASSTSSTGQWYSVVDLHCNCKAGQAGRYCKHVAAVLLFHEAAEAERRAHTCGHCGHTGEDVGPQIAHVGGQGEVEVIRCQNTRACWRRWEYNNGLTLEYLDRRDREIEWAMGDN